MNAKTSMKWLTQFRSLLCMAALAAISVVIAPAANAQAARIVVRVQPGVDAKSLAKDFDCKVAGSLKPADLYTLSVPAGGSELEIEDRLRLDSRIVYAERDETIVNTELDGNPIHFAFDANSTPGAYANSQAYSQIQLPAPSSMPACSAEVIVAVVDTGIAVRHPILKGRLAPGYNAIAPKLSPTDAPDDTGSAAVGHGTMVAGIVLRVAPNARIMPVKVLDGSGMGSVWNVVSGIHYAIAHGARVLNLSFSSTLPSEALRDALDAAENAGVVVVASAGNDGNNLPHYPAAAGAIGVASVERDNVKSDYSDYGRFVRIAAPGTGIRSTYWTGGYATWSGTSFAAPFVTGTAALLLAVKPTLTAEQAVEAVLESARPLDGVNPALRGQLGHGLLNVRGALGMCGGGRHD